MMNPMKIPSLHDLSMLAQRHLALAQCLDFYERRIYTLEQALMVAVVILANQLEETQQVLKDQTGSTFNPQQVDREPQH
jgi:hypothetical protein